jgi:hypothetical protein
MRVREATGDTLEVSEDPIPTLVFQGGKRGRKKTAVIHRIFLL